MPTNILIYEVFLVHLYQNSRMLHSYSSLGKGCKNSKNLPFIACLISIGKSPAAFQNSNWSWSEQKWYRDTCKLFGIKSLHFLQDQDTALSWLEACTRKWFEIIQKCNPSSVYHKWSFNIPKLTISGTN